ncbi:MAG: tRNA (adenosine(37)-N6)-threonylcarbamoyltransferase complex transferase subunit TsaD [Chloroflexi bacterium]|nr:tRNA (adenosine(37)-N6)-threonylcarbamoyltransferase complex transferase subunit TsaD [Chloroflexota bacterium]
MSNAPLRILGIETSCDETSAAIVEGGRTILSNAIASQIDLHAKYGGVFPEMASRMHVEAIYPIVTAAMSEAHVGWGDIDAIAVTRGPGLVGSLLVGLNAAKGIAIGRGLPLVGVNHLEGHVYSLWLVEDAPEVAFPVIVLIVSGGHTELLLMTGHGQYQSLGRTLDDAAGEAFDKVGRLLGLPFPGGPSIEKAAQDGDPTAYAFPRAWLDQTWDFSFSGVKTAVLKEVKKQWPGMKAGVDAVPPGLPVPNLAASFQAAVIDVLAEKTAQAAAQLNATEVFIAGGVSANIPLRTELARRAKVPVRYPPLVLCTDNAAMIATAGHYRYLAGQRDGLEIDVKPNWKLT